MLYINKGRLKSVQVPAIKDSYRGINQMFTTSKIDPGTAQPLLVDVKIVAKMLGRCERSVWRDSKAGRIPRPIELNGSKRWRLKEIRQWVRAGCPSREAWESRRSPSPLKSQEASHG